jgi:SWI/SNF-related matrix-associated actin-dependent regulator 1 of chromatin subfamily A
MASAQVAESLAPVPLYKGLEALREHVTWIPPEDQALFARLDAIPADAWGEAGYRCAWRLLERRIAILIAEGVEFHLIPPGCPDFDSYNGVRSIFVRDGKIVLSFTFDRQLKAQVQVLPSHFYDHGRREHVLEPTREVALALGALVKQDRGSFGISPTAQTLLRELYTESPLEPSERRVAHEEDGHWRLYSPPPTSQADLAFAAAARNVAKIDYCSATADRAGHWDLGDHIDPILLARLIQDFRVQISSIDRELLLKEGIAVSPPVRRESANQGELITLRRTFKLMFARNSGLMQRVKQMDGARWERTKTRWSVSHTFGNAQVLHSMIDAGDLVAEDEAIKKIEELEDLRARVLEQRTTMAEVGEQQAAGIEALDVPLMNFQVDGVRSILRRRNVLLADEQGLGKTLSSLSAVVLAEAYPAVVVAPAAMLLTWRKEANRWYPLMRTKVLRSRTPKPEDLRENDLLILNYEIAGAWAPAIVAAKPKALIVDEAHFLASKSSQRTEAVQTISDGVDPGGLIVVASGTPFRNRPRELVPVLQTIRRLDDFGGDRSFRVRYCNLHKTCMIRRLKEDALPDLPKKLPQADVPVAITTTREYRRLNKEVIAELLAVQAEQRTYTQALAEGANKRDATARAIAAAWRARGAASIVLLNRLRECSSVGKVKAANEWIDAFLAGGRKLIVFSSFIATQKALVEANPDCVSILGGDSARKREAAKDRFQEDEKCRLIICSLQTAGVGLTLTAASDVLHVDLPWTAAEFSQAEDRAHRIGQVMPVQSWVMEGVDTIDAHIAAIVDRKRRLFNLIVDGKVTAEAEEDSEGSTVEEVVRRIILAG